MNEMSVSGAVLDSNAAFAMERPKNVADFEITQGHCVGKRCNGESSRLFSFESRVAEKMIVENSLPGIEVKARSEQIFYICIDLLPFSYHSFIHEAVNVRANGQAACGASVLSVGLDELTEAYQQPPPIPY